uniref:Uncharacterized protein n=1 Tax=Timema bartmani TaxID=61472 RepID=A0A7R9I3G0_9NEOP|nr:unnamed protein product [Timema bartmani]
MKILAPGSVRSDAGISRTEPSAAPHADKRDLEAFKAFLMVLRHKYRHQPSILHAIIKLLHLYQPEDGPRVYLKCLEVLCVLLGDMESELLRYLISIIPPPNHSPSLTNRVETLLGASLLHTPQLHVRVLPTIDAQHENCPCKTKMSATSPSPSRATFGPVVDPDGVYLMPGFSSKDYDLFIIEDADMSWLEGQGSSMDKQDSPSKSQNGDAKTKEHVSDSPMRRESLLQDSSNQVYSKLETRASLKETIVNYKILPECTKESANENAIDPILQSEAEELKEALAKSCESFQVVRDKASQDDSDRHSDSSRTVTNAGSQESSFEGSSDLQIDETSGSDYELIDDTPLYINNSNNNIVSNIRIVKEDGIEMIRENEFAISLSPKNGTCEDPSMDKFVSSPDTTQTCDFTPERRGSKTKREDKVNVTPDRSTDVNDVAIDDTSCDETNFHSTDINQGKTRSENNIFAPPSSSSFVVMEHLSQPSQSLEEQVEGKGCLNDEMSKRDDQIDITAVDDDVRYKENNQEKEPEIVIVEDEKSVKTSSACLQERVNDEDLEWTVENVHRVFGFEVKKGNLLEVSSDESCSDDNKERNVRIVATSDSKANEPRRNFPNFGSQSKRSKGYYGPLHDRRQDLNTLSEILGTPDCAKYLYKSEENKTLKTADKMTSIKEPGILLKRCSFPDSEHKIQMESKDNQYDAGTLKGGGCFQSYSPFPSRIPGGFTGTPVFNRRLVLYRRPRSMFGKCMVSPAAHVMDAFPDQVRDPILYQNRSSGRHVGERLDPDQVAGQKVRVLVAKKYSEKRWVFNTRFLGARDVPASVTNLTDTEDIVASPEEPDSGTNPQGGQQTNNKRQKLEDIVQVLKKHKRS